MNQDFAEMLSGLSAEKADFIIVGRPQDIADVARLENKDG